MNKLKYKWQELNVWIYWVSIIALIGCMDTFATKKHVVPVYLAPGYVQKEVKTIENYYFSKSLAKYDSTIHALQSATFSIVILFLHVQGTAAVI